MKAITYSVILSLAALSSFFVSCKRDHKNPDPAPVTPVANKHQVKYEISGSYSGYLLVVYYDNVSGNTTDTVKSLPWSKEIIYKINVSGVGISANSVMGHFGAPSQAVSIKIYSAGSSVKEQNSITDNYGAINMPSLAYVFP